MTNRIFILRHGQAEMFSPDGDFARRLTPRGQEDCRQAGILFQQRNWVPDRILCSAAARTRMSLEAFTDGFRDRLPAPIFLEEIYEADIDTLWSILAQNLENVGDILIIGHNPGLSMLTEFLARDDLDEKNLFPSLAPASLAVIDCGEQFERFSPNAAKIIDLIHPAL